MSSFAAGGNECQPAAKAPKIAAPNAQARHHLCELFDAASATSRDYILRVARAMATEDTMAVLLSITPERPLRLVGGGVAF